MKRLPYTLNTYPWRISLNKQVFNDIIFHVNGIFHEGGILIDYEEMVCKVTIQNQTSKCCLLLGAEKGTTMDLCLDYVNELVCENKTLMFAKKYAIDCNRFKHPQNDMVSISKENKALETVALNKRSSREQLDGNTYEALSPNPGDSYFNPIIVTQITEPLEGYEEDISAKVA